jgi:N-acetylglucosaminyldiphosphoundecaprenol N-acetyl-beta-D-mannosaminyltransferase
VVSTVVTENEKKPVRPLSPVTPVAWPPKYDVFGVGVSATHGLAVRGGNVEVVDHRAELGVRPRHAQPVRWTLKWFHKQPLPDRCYGPELMIRLCRAAANEGVTIYLYGSSEDVLERLSENLTRECPGLIIAGAESPPFRKLEPHEIDAAIRRMNESGAGLIFIGLGCPRQDVFAKEHKQKIKAVQLCVGAAFDFHAGNKKMAPRWMQKRGLEWFYRLTQEPTRLWKRYLVIHTTFAFLLTRRLILGR